MVVIPPSGTYLVAMTQRSGGGALVTKKAPALRSMQGRRRGH